MSREDDRAKKAQRRRARQAKARARHESGNSRNQDGPRPSESATRMATLNLGSPVYGDGSNPGSGAICDRCKTPFYIDGMLPAATVSLDQPGAEDFAVEHLIGPCPRCQGFGTAKMVVAESDAGRAFATHPFGALLALEALRSALEAGDLEPDEAVEILDRHALLRPLADWIRQNGGRILKDTILNVLVAAVFYALAQSQSLTADDVDRIVQSAVEDALSKVVTDEDEPPAQPPGTTRE